MSFTETFLVALALAMDAFAVSIACGVTIHRLHLRHALRIAAAFGIFQAVMPLIGWVLGWRLRMMFVDLCPWVACVILWIVGLKMIWESFRIRQIEDRRNPLHLTTLLGLALATSIDAFSTGVTFAMLDVYIVSVVIIIGLVTFVVCMLGVWIGDRGKHFFERRMETVAGLVVIAIGIKIIIESR